MNEHELTDADRERLTDSIVRVGDSMGVVVSGGYILTAAHVVREIAEPWGTRFVPVNAWPEPVGDGEQMLRDSDAFDDPNDLAHHGGGLGQVITYEPGGDIAVLADPGPPLGLEKLLESHPALIAFDFLPHATEQRDVGPFTVHVLSCEGAWVKLECHRAFESRGFLRGAAVAQLPPGTSGSPVWNDDGRVVGLMTARSRTTGAGDICVLAQALPVWLVEKIRAEQEPPKEWSDPPR